MARTLLYTLLGVLVISIVGVATRRPDLVETLKGYVELGGQKEEVVDLEKGRTLIIGQDEKGGMTVEQQAGKVPESKDIGSTVNAAEKEAAARKDTGGLAQKVADGTTQKSAGDQKKAAVTVVNEYPIPNGAELIYTSKEGVLGIINRWKKEDTNPKDVPTYLTTYSNGEETLCLGLAGLELGKTLYAVYRFFGGDKPLVKLGTIRVPKGSKVNEADMVNAFYHLLEICKGKGIEGRQVVYILGEKPCAYVEKEVTPISFSK